MSEYFLSEHEQLQILSRNKENSDIKGLVRKINFQAAKIRTQEALIQVLKQKISRHETS